MITLEKGQAVPENEHIVVLEGGEYDDEALVLCAPEWETEGTAYFVAKFIENGPEIYQ